MKNKYVYITDSEWFEASSLRNPICFMDHKIEQTYPEFYELDYDLKILATRAPTEEEKSMPIYNDYREKYGDSDISVIDTVTHGRIAKNIFLNGFNQEQFEHIAPLIKETAEVLYLFKCTKVKDLSALSDFKNLKCLFIFGNNSLESLWDMRYNDDLKIISFVYVTKLREIGSLIDSNIEYVNFDSSDNCGNKKEMLLDKEIFTKISTLKHLTLIFKGI